MTSHVAWRGLPPRNRRAWSRWLWRACAVSSKERVRLKSSCEPFGNYLIQALRLSMIWRPRLPPRGCQCATRAPTSGHRRDLPPGHKRDQRFDEGRPGARSWKRLAASSWLSYAANRCRSERRTSTQPLSWLADSDASPWTKTTCGWPRRLSPSVRRWSAATGVSEVLTACRCWRWSNR